jgi:hypothetical protein
MGPHAVLSGRKDWRATERLLENLSKAERSYLADSDLRGNLDEVGWSEARTIAAHRGEAIMVDPETNAAPVLGLTKMIQEQAGPSITLSPWSAFADLRHEVFEEQLRIKRGAFREIRAAAQARERELLDELMRTPPAEADALVDEYQDLLETHRDCAGLAGMRDNLRLPRPDRVDLPAILRAVQKGRSLLDPLPEDEADQPRVILRRPPPGGHPAPVVPNRHMRAPEDAGPVQRVGAEVERQPPIRRRTEVEVSRLENPPADAPRVPPMPQDVP